MPAVNRVRSILPVPKPLPRAIDDAHFGRDEDGKPIRPTSAEVREITEAHADKLRNLLLDLREAHGDDRAPIAAAFDQGITDYADSFGDRAGEQLRAYVARIVCEPVISPYRAR